MNIAAVKEALQKGGKFLVKYWDIVLTAAEKVPDLLIKIKELSATVAFTIAPIQKHRILIFGDSGAGKTALRYYLLNKKPFRKVKEEAGVVTKAPEPTAGTEEITSGKRKITKDDGIILQYDVGGEALYHDIWADLIEQIKPQGIVYMADGRLSDEELDKVIETMFEKVIVHLVPNENRNAIRAVYLFLNFSDIWSSGTAKDRDRARMILDKIETKRAAYDERLEHLTFNVVKSQLSPMKSEWLEADKAVKHLLADLHC